MAAGVPNPLINLCSSFSIANRVQGYLLPMVIQPMIFIDGGGLALLMLSDQTPPVGPLFYFSMKMETNLKLFIKMKSKLKQFYSFVLYFTV